MMYQFTMDHQSMRLSSVIINQILIRFQMRDVELEISIYGRSSISAYRLLAWLAIVIRINEPILILQIFSILHCIILASVRRGLRERRIWFVLKSSPNPSTEIFFVHYFSVSFFASAFAF